MQILSVPWNRIHLVRYLNFKADECSLVISIPILVFNSSLIMLAHFFLLDTFLYVKTTTTTKKQKYPRQRVHQFAVE